MPGKVAAKRGVVQSESLEMTDPSTSTSFENYQFNYRWNVSDIYKYLRARSTLKSPEFSSPSGSEYNPATLWQMEVFQVYPSEGGEYLGVRVFLKSCDSSSHGCWSTANVSICTQSQSGSLISTLASWRNSVPQELIGGTDSICNKKCLKIDGRDDRYVRITCSLQVYKLDSPKHTGKAILVRPVPTVSIPEHNLGQTMEEARQSGLLTDVTLVTGEKELKAHKLILAAQSSFFKTRFEQRWEQSGDRVELNDVSPEILEAVLKYMYTGQVEIIDDTEMTCKPFSVADEYGLEKLRTTCEAMLVKSISDENVVDVLILADTHNGKDLKKVCIEYVVRNPSPVKKSSAWSKL